LNLAPDLVVVSIALDDQRQEVEEKMSRWLMAGSRLAWMLDADLGNIMVYGPRQLPRAKPSAAKKWSPGSP
jgi:hypothetical protein